MIVHTCSFCSYLIKGAKWHPKLLKVRCKSQSKEVQLGTPNHEKEVLMKKQGPDLRYLRRAIRRGRFFGIYGLIEPYFTWSLNIDHWFTGPMARTAQTAPMAQTTWTAQTAQLPKRPNCPTILESGKKVFFTVLAFLVTRQKIEIEMRASGERALEHTFWPHSPPQIRDDL